MPQLALQALNIQNSSPKMICLIYDEDLMSNPLSAQKAVKTRREFKQLVKPVTKWNNNRHTVLPP